MSPFYSLLSLSLSHSLSLSLLISLTLSISISVSLSLSLSLSLSFPLSLSLSKSNSTTSRNLSFLHSSNSPFSAVSLQPFSSSLSGNFLSLSVFHSIFLYLSFTPSLPRLFLFHSLNYLYRSFYNIRSVIPPLLPALIMTMHITDSPQRPNSRVPVRGEHHNSRPSEQI